VDTGRKLKGIVIWLGVAILQLIATQVVTFILSMIIPGMEDFPQTHSVLFALILGLTFATGVFLVGWLAIKFHWLSAEPRYPARLAGTLIGAYLPLIAALIIYRILEPGNPFFFISMLASILGFHLPGWLKKG
jgi:hypothetical protein